MEWNLLEEVLLDVGMLVAPVAFYILVRRFLVSVPDPRLQIYSTPGWNYHLKRAWAWYCLYRQPNPTKKTSNSHQLPIHASDEEFRIEKPKKILRDRSMDLMLMHGVDSQGNCLVVKIVRKYHNQAEVWLYLTLANGNVYELPVHPDTTVPTTHGADFQAGNLKFTQIEPMRKWRITYNGILRKSVSNEWISMQDEDKLVHARLNFIWTACSSSTDAREAWSRKLLSDALAKEHWRSGNWFSVVGLEPPGYDQFGVLDGLVRFGETDEGTRLYLRGGRERRWGEVQEESVIRSIKLQGVASNGTFFCIRATCRHEGLTQAKWGIVRTPTGKVNSVTSCDLNLSEVGHFKNLPHQLVIRFSAGTDNYIASLQFQEKSGATLYSGNPWRLQTFLRKLQFGMNGLQGTGIAEFSYKYRKECPVPKVPVIGQLVSGHWEAREGKPPLVCGLHDHAAQVENLVGGKGVSLALLSSLKTGKFTVPAGFCVTTVAYQKQMVSSPVLQTCIQNIKDVARGHKRGILKIACEKTVAAFEEQELCNEVKISIENYLQKFSCDTIFAVRSSAVGEDSEDLSCAGQNISLLGVKCKGVSAAVVRCWASLFSDHSVEYRRRNGQPLDPNMGVVIQEMVPAETAGVLFTRHPFSGNPQQLVITANYGLGESVVSALIEPDTIIVSRSWNDKVLKVQEVKLGSKQEGIMLSQDGEGTQNNKLTEEEQQKLCLRQRQILVLSEVGVELEKLFGTARDIEWAFIKDKLFLLQARPITALDSWTDFELQHEMDSPIVTDTEPLTFANTGEVLPGATTPLTQTVLTRILDYEIQMECIKRNDKRCVSPQYQNIICTTSHHITLSIVNTLLSNNEEKVSFPNKVMDLAVFGHLVTDEKLHKIGVERFGVMSKLGKLLKIYDMIRDCATASRETKQAKHDLKQLSLRAEDHTTSTSLYAAISNQMPLLVRAAQSHGHMSRTSVFTQVAALTVLTEGKEEFTTEHFTDISLLLSSCSDVESAEIPSQLKELAAIIAEEDSEFFCSASPSQAINWIQTESAASTKFRAFLIAHGHRSIREFEFHTLTWGMQPENLITTLQALVRSPHPGPDNTTCLNVAETCQLLKSPTKEGTRRALRFILPYCRTAVGRREQSKSSLISAVQTFRLGYRQLANLLVKEGKLPEADLLFYMTHYEIGTLVKQADSVVLAKAFRRKRLWKTWESLKYPEIMYGIPKPLEMQDQLVGEGLHTLSATPVCAGVVLGRACVVAELSQMSEIIQGDILITHSTDIGWSPYFPLLAGIVTELGGLISHGAVVAREYGLPCIVGASNATYLFKTGDLVRLNGGTGVLEKISTEPLNVE